MSSLFASCGGEEEEEELRSGAAPFCGGKYDLGAFCEYDMGAARVCGA